MDKRADTSWQSLYPFASQYVDANGYRLHYVDEGSGSPVVMVHGNPTWSFLWRNLIARFRDEHRMIAIDHLGCGHSDKPAIRSYTLREHADNLSQLIRQLDLTDITLVVHDWGGAIGLETAARMPERLSRLVLLNTGAFPPPRIPWRIAVCRWPVVGKLALQGANLFARAATRMALNNPGAMPRAAKQGMLAPYDTWRNRSAIYRFVRDIPTSPRHPTWHSLEALEASLDRLAHLPTCIIWGMQDWCFDRSCLERMHGHFPGAQVHRLEEVGHWVPEEAPEPLAEILASFLRATAKDRDNGR